MDDEEELEMAGDAVSSVADWAGAMYFAVLGFAQHAKDCQIVSADRDAIEVIARVVRNKSKMAVVAVERERRAGILQAL